MANSETSFYIYDVFLSFRGEDTRASFVSHLYASLQNAGIVVFKDDESLRGGDNISNSILRTIEQSQIFVVVFSKNYAESRWCHQELRKIMACHRTTGQVVLPVFYDVDPSDVRHQTGHFGEAFQKLEEKVLKEEGVLRCNKMMKLRREDLRQAAAISGVVVLNSRNESEIIKTIVENVTHLLDKTELFVADNPVGVEPRVQEMIELLDQKLTNDVLLLGMWGMGGIGKTTIAKAIYNKIGRNFEGRSFLAHIREVWTQDAGQVHLQEQLLFDIYKERKTKIRNVESGKGILKESLCYKKVLLVLDDVNELEQLNVLCGNCKWFGPGSRIIITTRDQHILRGRVDKLYTMKGMDESESIELFSWHAFKQASPKENFTQLSRKVITYSGGLPLALEVLGCYLFDMKVTEWENVLKKLKRIPNHQVQKKLKISYDGLDDDTEKEIFLDIACFFIGMNRSDVVHILNGCGLFAENGIRVLVERSLVTIDDKSKLGMHDLLRDMGREIVRAKSPKEPEKRSRLWFDEDALDVLSKETGTKAIEGLALKLAANNTKCLGTKAFKKMEKLRLLQLAGVRLDGDFKYLSRDLRWLCWHRFPLKCIPTNFYQRSLISIDLQNSNVQLLWKEAELLEKLKVLNLSHSHYLTQTPDFSNLPNLEKLELVDCPRLCQISNTIGDLNQVLQINLQDCISLRNLPRSIYKLKSLKTLILSGCLKIDKLEEDLEQMDSLTILVADKTAIKGVPFSIVRSKSIGYISLCGYEGFSRDVFPSIIWSWMSPTNSLSSRIQTSSGTSSLVSLDVPNSNIHNLSYVFEDLPKLQSLFIECDSELQLTREVKSIVDALYATNYEQSESTSTTSQMPNINAFTLIECNNQVHTSGSENLLGCHLIQMGKSCQVTHNLRQSILQNRSSGECDYLLPGDNHPDWLSFNCEGSSVIFEVPQVDGRILKTMMCHIHFFSPDNIKSCGLINLLVINRTKSTIQVHKRDALFSCDNEKWQKVLSNTESGNKVEIVVVYERKLIVKRTTVYLIYEPIYEEMEHYQASNKNAIVSSGDENVCAVRSTSPDVYNQFGHRGRERGDRSGRRGGHGGQSNVQCQLCNKLGHIAADCFHRFDPNYVAQSNFQFQNQFPQYQHVFQPSQGGCLPNQQQYHFSYMHPTQIPYSQHSEFQTVSSVSVPPMSYPQGYTTNSCLSRAPAQESQNWFINSGNSHHDHVFLGNGHGLPVQYGLDPNYAAQSNFQFQNQFPQQYAAMQPFFPPSHGGPFPHQQHRSFLFNASCTGSTSTASTQVDHSVLLQGFFCSVGHDQFPSLLSSSCSKSTSMSYSIWLDYKYVTCSYSKTSNIMNGEIRKAKKSIKVEGCESYC